LTSTDATQIVHNLNILYLIIPIVSVIHTSIAPARGHLIPATINREDLGISERTTTIYIAMGGATIRQSC
jgi:hypothetical protein